MERRLARARRLRRRRLIATLALLGAFVLAGLKLLDRASSGTAGGPEQNSESARHASHNSGRHTELVRNARPQPGWQPHTGPVPILVYHALGTPPPSEEYPGLYVSDREFREEMAWLQRNDYQGVTLDEVERAWYRHGTLPAKPIVITFDNGYPPQVRFAPAVLGKYGWPGVLFEITEEHLTPPYIRPVVAMGWEVDSHSATHPDLTQLSGAQLE
ncbi:MAG: polysaccharide deacetylase family protein, partial [Mycobacteriales bacterium]